MEILNTPITALAVGALMVAVNSFLLFGYYLPRTTTTPPSAVPALTEPTTPKTTTTAEQTPQPRTTPEETTTSTATPTATATATATPSP